MSKNTKTVIILLVIAVLIAIVPLFALKNAEFGGSDDAGSQMISEIQGKEYEPWFTPVLESALGGYVERKKWTDKLEKDKKEDHAESTTRTNMV